MAQAQEGGSIGVEVGDWANYSITSFSYESNVPGLEEPPVELAVLASIEWFIGEVMEVSGNSVTMQAGTYYDDGTNQFETITGNPVAGTGNLSDSLAPENLSLGDQFYIWLEEWGLPGPQLATVSETTSRAYAGETRQANHVILNLPHPDRGDFSFDYYYDKETGIVCEWVTVFSHEVESYYTSFSWSGVITETNLWGPDSVVIPDPEVVSDTTPVTLDAVETASAMVVIFNISDSCVIKIEQATDAPPPPSGAVDVVNSVFINTSEMVTTRAVLRLSYDPEALAEQGITESSLVIHYWDSTEWVPVESQVNTDEHYVSADIEHFSYWTLLGETTPTEEEGVPIVWIIVPVVCVVIAVLALLYLRRQRSKV
ncbi:MAG TPA: hypothetical protein G4O10_08010 [Dehalococcoidia bacterium]|nr:hypothetical protein [Dehalococcoidia bacterium]